MDSLFHHCCNIFDIVRITKNGGLRFHVDYRRLIKITVKTRHFFIDQLNIGPFQRI